jgi:hypothetical protein
MPGHKCRDLPHSRYRTIAETLNFAALKESIQKKVQQSSTAHYMGYKLKVLQNFE